MNNNISFQGRSSLYFDTKMFDQLSNSIKGNIKKLGCNNKSTLPNGKYFITSTDSANLAVIVRNQNDGFINFLPLKGSLEKKFNEFLLQVDRLKDSAKGNLTAWIVGGDKIKGENGTRTINVLNKVADVLCDRPDIDTSILVGIKGKQENIVLHTIKDFVEMTLDRPKGTILEDVFDVVEINNTKFV